MRITDALSLWCRRLGIRTLVVCAHPDDEVLGTGGLLHAGAEVSFVHVTDGAPRDERFARSLGFATREALAAARREELRAAMRLAGQQEAPCHELGVVDQEAMFHMPAIARDLRDIFTRERPALVLTHAYEGGHPDHDATALGVRAAAALVARQGVAAPVVAEMAGYHGAGGGFHVARFLPDPTRPVVEARLTDDERARKRALLGCFRSQQWLLGAFDARDERFRLAPARDFAHPPHAGALLYERHGWRSAGRALTGDRFRKLAGDALASLGLGREI